MDIYWLDMLQYLAWSILDFGVPQQSPSEVLEYRYFSDTNCNKGPVIIYDRGPRRKTTFYGKKFRGPLSARTKNVAAHSASHDNFSMPTLDEYHR